MSVYEITLADPTEPGRPAERVLRICAVGDMAFLSVDAYDEGNPTTTTTVLAEIAVSLPGLKEAISLLSNDGERERLRQKDERGNLLADLSGTRYVRVPI